MLEYDVLQKRIRILLVLVMAGLVVSGLMALPLRAEISWMERVAGESSKFGQRYPDFGEWMSQVDTAMGEITEKYAFLFYGTDWMAFGLVVSALLFVGPLRDPVRNIWVIEYGLIVSVFIFPMALISGTCRGIPLLGLLGDASFGVVGAVLFWFIRHYTVRLTLLEKGPTLPS